MTDGGARKVEVLEEQRLHEGFISLDRALVRFECSDGRMSEPVERMNAERGDAVGVLLYDPRRDAVVLVEQFRYPAYLVGEEGWLLEMVAGTLRRGCDAAAVARAEAKEEAGYCVADLHPLVTCFLTPGGSTERITLYWATVDLDSPVGTGGGLRNEGEDTRVRIVSRAEALRMVRDGRIRDAKTIIALLFLEGLTLGRAQAENEHGPVGEPSNRDPSCHGTSDRAA